MRDLGHPIFVDRCLVLDDGGEGVGFEAGAADECAVDFFLAAESGGVVGLDAAAVEDAHLRLRPRCRGVWRLRRE